jgi:hypothetical protein
MSIKPPGKFLRVISPDESREAERILLELFFAPETGT